MSDPKMTVEVVKKGKKKVMVITMPMNKHGEVESKSGKSWVISSSGGNKATGLDLNGDEIFVGVNAFCKKPKEEE